MSETTRELFTAPETYEKVRIPVPEPEAGKSYALRELKAADVFIVSKIIGSIGIKEFRASFESDAVKAAMKNAQNTDVMAVGMTVFLDIADVIFRNIPKCEKDVYAFLASLSGMEIEEVESLPMVTFIEMIIDVIKKEEFKDFMTVVSKLFK